MIRIQKQSLLSLIIIDILKYNEMNYIEIRYQLSLVLEGQALLTIQLGSRSGAVKNSVIRGSWLYPSGNSACDRRRLPLICRPLS